MHGVRQSSPGSPAARARLAPVEAPEHSRIPTREAWPQSRRRPRYPGQQNRPTAIPAYRDTGLSGGCGAGGGTCPRRSRGACRRRGRGPRTRPTRCGTCLPPRQEKELSFLGPYINSCGTCLPPSRRARRAWPGLHPPPAARAWTRTRRRSCVCSAGRAGCGCVMRRHEAGTDATRRRDTHAARHTRGGACVSESAEAHERPSGEAAPDMRRLSRDAQPMRCMGSPEAHPPGAAHAPTPQLPARPPLPPSGLRQLCAAAISAPFTRAPHRQARACR